MLVWAVLSSGTKQGHIVPPLGLPSNQKFLALKINILDVHSYILVPIKSLRLSVVGQNKNGNLLEPFSFQNHKLVNLHSSMSVGETKTFPLLLIGKRNIGHRKHILAFCVQRAIVQQTQTQKI